jgi:hypothetical protein
MSPSREYRLGEILGPQEVFVAGILNEIKVAEQNSANDIGIVISTIITNKVSGLVTMLSQGLISPHEFQAGLSCYNEVMLEECLPTAIVPLEEVVSRFPQLIGDYQFPI